MMVLALHSHNFYADVHRFQYVGLEERWEKVHTFEDIIPLLVSKLFLSTRERSVFVYVQHSLLL